MLISEVQTRVSRQFGDPANAQFDSEDVLRWINDGIIDLSINNDLAQATATVALSSGVNTVNLPTDLLILKSVKLNGRKLDGTSQQEADETWDINGNNGVPTAFYVWMNKLYLYPTPNISAQLSVNYTQTVTLDGSDDVELPLPVQYHTRIVEYCLAQAAELNGDPNQYQLKKGEFLRNTAEIRNSTDNTDQDYYPSITASPADYGDSTFIGGALY